MLVISDGSIEPRIAVICSTGMLPVKTNTGTGNGDKFYDYLRGSLLPQMLSYGGTNQKSICGVRQLLHVSYHWGGCNAGVVVLCLPPCILTWCQLKKHLDTASKNTMKFGKQWMIQLLWFKQHLIAYRLYTVDLEYKTVGIPNLIEKQRLDNSN